MASRSAIILPDDSAQPIVAAVEAAAKTLRIKMFIFSHPELLQAVIAAHRRGVKVRVMLNPTRRSGEEENNATRTALKKAGVNVKDSNPAFGLTHEKSMVVDDAVAFIKSLNWTTENLTATRDYAITTSHAHEVSEVIAGFEADWDRQPFEPGEKAHLIWCNSNGRERIARFIDEAKHTLFVQNERYQDAVIIERLVRAKERGVKVHIMARPPHTLKKDKLIEGVGGLRIMDDVGIKIHKPRHLKLHGKLLIADKSRAIVGSINLAPGSFDSRRELAIEVHDEDVVHRLQKIAHYDWKHSHPLDLSDEGLFQDLQKRGGEGADKLVLAVADKQKTAGGKPARSKRKAPGRPKTQAKKTAAGKNK